MSAVAPARSTRRHPGRLLQRFASTRGVEVCALQASPVIGASLGGLTVDGSGLARLGLLLLGSVPLTAHVFLINDWADYRRDEHDPRRVTADGTGDRLERGQIAWIAGGLLVLAEAAFASLGVAAVGFGTAIAGLSLLYSCSPRLGKGTPGAASLNHLIGGALHFLLGLSVVHAVNSTAAALSLVFGVVFAAGHLNQEVRDYEGDRVNGVGTLAARFGRRQGFLASFALFSTAYLLILMLAALGTLPRFLLASAVLWTLQATWSLQALRRGLSAETALWMQRRYRLLFAVIGLGMLLG